MKKIILTILVISNISLFAFEYNSGFISLNEFEDLSVKHNGVKINNFTLSEKESWSTRSLVNLGISFSAKNKNEKSKHFSLMLVGLDKDNAVLWSLSAEPMMATIQGHKTESVSKDAFVLPGTLKKTVSILAKITGDF